MPPSHSRDPVDYSPTSTSFLAPNPITSGSVRRNLFSTHLSRRPASGAQSPPQLDGSTETHNNPRSEVQARQQPHGTNPSRLRHQRSVSTPSLSPSPPRTSPFHNATFIPPPLPQLSPPHHRGGALQDGYDPTISPNKPLSPRSSAALFPNQSIIALNPLTGRPVLPKLPVLPGRLRLTDSDDEMEDAVDQEDENEEDYDDELVEIHEPHNPDDDLPVYPRQAGGRRAPRHGDPYSRSHDHDQAQTEHPHAHADSQSLALAAAQARAQAEIEASDEASSSRRDRERIERLLREMMARQRARANATAKPNISGGPSSSSMAAPHDEEGDNDDEEGESKDSEKEELMGLIMGSLRREVARAEEEGWMFGERVGMGALVGRDEVGVYD